MIEALRGLFALFLLTLAIAAGPMLILEMSRLWECKLYSQSADTEWLYAPIVGACYLNYQDKWLEKGYYQDIISE